MRIDHRVKSRRNHVATALGVQAVWQHHTKVRLFSPVDLEMRWAEQEWNLHAFPEPAGMN
jgi:hypothetical protein